MNIINIGGWYVGNTALLDWLDGFKGVHYHKGDFDVLREPDGIMDIIAEDNIINKQIYIDNLKRKCLVNLFRSAKHKVGKYTKNLFLKVKPTSYNSDLTFHLKLYIRLRNFQIMLKTFEKSDEIKFWKHWLETLIDVNKKEIDTVFFQNPIYYDEMFDAHKTIWPILFEPYKIIFVHRSPLDQFSDIVESGSHLISDTKRFHGDTENLDPADRFLYISRKIYQARIRMVKEYDPSNLLIVSFEDFILNHDFVSKQILHFLNIKEDTINNQKRFDIKKSAQNIEKWKHNKEMNDLLIDKPYIMKELESYREILQALPHSTKFKEDAFNE